MISSNGAINEIINKNNILCRSYLMDYEDEGIERIQNFEPENLLWFKINGIMNFWKDKDQSEYDVIFENILSGFTVASTSCAFLILGDKKQGIEFYVGTSEISEVFDSFLHMYRAFLPGIDITNLISSNELNINKKYNGVVVGFPNGDFKESEYYSKQSTQAIDIFSRGMLGSDFSLLFIAERLPEVIAKKSNEKMLETIMNVSEQVSTSRRNEAGIQLNYNNSIMEGYYSNLQELQKVMELGQLNGLWNTSVYYSVEDERDLSKIKSTIKSAYRKNSGCQLEVLRCIDIGIYDSNLNSICGFIEDVDSFSHKHPLYNLEIESIPTGIYTKKYQTIMNSKLLSSFWRLPQKEIPGYFIDDYVEFETAKRQTHRKFSNTSIEDTEYLKIGSVIYAGRDTVNEIDNNYEMEIDDLTRHALIIGMTGGGKTNTTKNILQNLWIRHGIPFLVIESAKREYIDMLNIDIMNEYENKKNNFNDLKLFTLGLEDDERAVKYRINPFEVTGKSSLQTHIDYLFSTFKAAFDLYAPMPYILEKAIYETYEEKGWNIETGKNEDGKRVFPTLTDLYNKIDTVTDGIGYEGDIQSNVKAALKARINSLRIGGKGAMLDTPSSMPIGEILNNPTIFELEDIGDDDTKAFIMGILLVQLYEYRKTKGKSDGKIKSVMVIEEAHRLLKNIPESTDGDNSRAKSIEFFCNMLAEIRSFGQGIIIADQIPTKLASDTIKNTNLKIVHRTVMEDDRNTIGSSMNMTEDQISYLSSLKRGWAAVFSEGDTRPKLVKMPLVKEREVQFTRDEIIRDMQYKIYREYGTYYTKH